MKIGIKATYALIISLMLGGLGLAADKKNDDQFEVFSTTLSSLNEVHFVAGPPAALRGAISSAATGSFKATLDKTTNIIGYELSYEGLESDITQSHIHFGQRHTVGGIVIWLCQTTGTPAPDAVKATTPFCPGVRSGKVTGTIAAAQVLPQPTQGIDAGQFDEILRALRGGATYANIHTATFTPGEIRGQVRRVGKDKSKGENEDNDD